MFKLQRLSLAELRPSYKPSWRAASRRSKRATSGFTLVETAVAVVIMALILLATMTVFIMASRMAVSANSTVFSTQDASNSLQGIVEETREASWLALPGEQYGGGVDAGQALFTPLPGYASIPLYYQTLFSNTTIDTAIELTYPAAGPSQQVYLASGNTLTLSTGTGNALYNRDNPNGLQVLIYRSDASGVPDPSAGMYLWEYSVTDLGATYNQSLIKVAETPALAAQLPDAVQFVRPIVGAGPNTEPYEVEIKLLCAYYSPINNFVTSESTNGIQSTQLTGKCVLMRDHETIQPGHNPNTGTAGDTLIGNKWRI